MLSEGSSGFLTTCVRFHNNEFTYYIRADTIYVRELLSNYKIASKLYWDDYRGKFIAIPDELKVIELKPMDNGMRSLFLSD